MGQKLAQHHTRRVLLDPNWHWPGQRMESESIWTRLWMCVTVAPAMMRPNSKWWFYLVWDFSVSSPFCHQKLCCCPTWWGLLLGLVVSKFCSLPISYQPNWGQWRSWASLNNASERRISDISPNAAHWFQQTYRNYSCANCWFAWLESSFCFQQQINWFCPKQVNWGEWSPTSLLWVWLSALSLVPSPVSLACEHPCLHCNCKTISC